MLPKVDLMYGSSEVSKRQALAMQKKSNICTPQCLNRCLREKCKVLESSVKWSQSNSPHPLSFFLPHPSISSPSPRSIWSHLWHFRVSKVVTDNTETQLSAAMSVRMHARVCNVLHSSKSLTLSLTPILCRAIMFSLQWWITAETSSVFLCVHMHLFAMLSSKLRLM